MNQFFKTKFLILVLFMQCYFSFAQSGMEVNYNVDIENPQKIKNAVNLLVPNPYDFTRLKTYRTNNLGFYNKGFLDVTKAPYNAGQNDVDCTAGIQNAIDDAREANLVVFFPGNRTYIVNKQLNCTKKNIRNSRKFSVQLLGAKPSNNIIKPKIKLSTAEFNPNITSYDKSLFLFGAQVGKLISNDVQTNSDGSVIYVSDDSRHYGSQFRGIDIDMGDNADKNAISMSGAQYCSIEDVAITGTNFNAGIVNLPGSGGFTANVSVTGGNYGIYQSSYRPNPSITGLTLINQKLAGIYLANTRGPLVVTGFKIESPNPAPTNYNGIQIMGSTNAANMQGALCLTDGSIEIKSTSSIIAIRNFDSHSITMNNVYVKSGIIISNNVKSIAGSTTVWKKVINYIFTSKVDKGAHYLYNNMANQIPSAADYDHSNVVDSGVIPPDLISKHVWNSTSMPSWQDTNNLGGSNIIDITAAPYGATADSYTYTYSECVTDANTKIETCTKMSTTINDDDTAAIQAAINNAFTIGHADFGKTVFIPRGHFHVSKLDFPSGLKIIGASKTFSVIQQKEDVLYTTDTKPLIQTGNNASGKIVMSDFGILTYPYATMLNIRTFDTTFRDILTEIVAEPKSCWEKCSFLNTGSRPYILFSDNAGGKIFGLCTDQLHVPRGNPTTYNISNYNLVRVTSVKPLEFHQISIESHTNSSQMSIEDAKDISIFGFKYEGKYELLNIVNSSNVKIIGGSGNYVIQDSSSSKALISIDAKSSNVFIQNLCRVFTDLYGISDTATNWIKRESSTVVVDPLCPVLSYTIGAGTTTTARVAKETNVALGFKTYINPLTKQLTIENLVNNETIEIYSILGNRVIQTRNLNGSVARININELSSGVYIVTVNNQSTKFLKNF